MMVLGISTEHRNHGDHASLKHWNIGITSYQQYNGATKSTIQ